MKLLISNAMTWTLFCDGSCLQNPGGSGGWSHCASQDGANSDILYADAGGCPVTTNNRMELKAVIEALKFVQETGDHECVVHTDSRLTLNCATGVWRRNANEDLWEEYNEAAAGLKVKFVWVQGHSGNVRNELVDKLALNEAIQAGYSGEKPKKVKRAVSTEEKKPFKPSFQKRSTAFNRPFKSLF